MQILLTVMKEEYKFHLEFENQPGPIHPAKADFRVTMNLISI